jgi:hypothetical protein
MLHLKIKEDSLFMPSLLNIIQLFYTDQINTVFTGSKKAIPLIKLIKGIEKEYI